MIIPMPISVSKPVHSHDCDCCEYHGSYIVENTVQDLYFCPRDGSLILRFGVDGEYSSMPVKSSRFPMPESMILQNKKYAPFYIILKQNGAI